MAKTPGKKAKQVKGQKPAPSPAKARPALRARPAKSKAPEAPRRKPVPAAPFPVVGLGASAGGLKALEGFFAKMPRSSGMAFVVVTHQHATQPSLMAEILGRKTEMPVVQISGPTAVEPDHVYTVRPGHDLKIARGVLTPVPVERKALPPLPIDSFFRSLARDKKEYAVGVVLSGTGSDGSLGVKAIKAELGMVMVQDEASAEYAGMPHSAINTELVDFVLPVAEMPKQLLAYTRKTLPRFVAPVERELQGEALEQVFSLIRGRTGHDFSHYKLSTMRRRIDRRIALHHLDGVKRYLPYLRANPAEIDLLFKELLIGVTAFFRDTEAWDALSAALPRLLADKPDEYVLRAWVPGCSTGEEAYSLAICLRESVTALKRPIGIQIFATDLDDGAINVARAGVYPSGIAEDVSMKRLSRFFTREDDSFRVKKEIREMLVFATQNVTADPPFTKIDILSCRNLLIYLDASLQKKLLPIFHYSLKPKGLLFLGSSESVGSSSDLFSTEDKKWKIFRRQEVASGTYVAEFPASRPDGGIPASTVAASGRATGQGTLAQLADRVLLRELLAPTVLVQERGDVVHVHGRTGDFLEPAPGSQAAANIFNMARDGLQISITAGIRQAAAEDREVVQRGVRVGTNGGTTIVDVRIRRLKEPEALRGLFSVTFERQAPVTATATRGRGGAGGPAHRLVTLERELQYAKESHQSTIEELETANEELKSTNEELQSTNEELQSTNEELETSKEEMQSLNEELQTVNAELQGKVEELSHANNDMKNLLNGTDIATVFLDNELRIKRYTDQAKRVIRLIPSDVGRSIADLVSSLDYDRLVDDAREVLSSLSPKEIEVRAQRDGEAWYLMRLLPYRTTDNVIDGLVLTFVDVSKLHRLKERQRLVLKALASSPTSIFGNDRELRYLWSYPYGSVFGRPLEELQGRVDEEVFGESAVELVELKRRVLSTGRSARRRVRLPVAGAPRTYDVFIEPTRDASGALIGVAGVATDVTSVE